MKIRHLQSLGYIVKSLPYWKYNIYDTIIRKKKNLAIFLSQAIFYDQLIFYSS